MTPLRVACAASALLLFSSHACRVDASSTLPAGGGEPFANEQPSLGLQYQIRVEGGFDDLGEVGLFAATDRFSTPVIPGWAPAEGQLLPIAGNESLFSQLGTVYGGDGENNFALPDLRGRTPIGAGTGPGLPTYQLGERVGAEQVTLAAAAPHTHGFGAGLTTESAGQGLAHSNLQPSLALTPIISMSGLFPSRSSIALARASGPDVAAIGATGAEPFYGEVTWLAHDNVPDGWAVADGSVLRIGQNDALFSLLGTMYGGDGVTTFALPDLRGRAATGAGNGPEMPNLNVGNAIGAADETLTLAQTPSHTHALPGGLGETDPAGDAAPQSNVQPMLAMTHLVALQGVFPSSGSTALATDGEPAPIAELGAGSEPFLGSLSMFAGNFTPRGYAQATGQALPIASNTSLFSLLVDTFGGDFTTYFNLPDLRGRLAVGIGEGDGLTQRELGEVFGAESSVLTEANLPEHDHAITALLGDYNEDGQVDAADYTVWRDNLGADEGTLPNDPVGGVIGQTHYDAWAANYGAGSGLSHSESVPEPAAALLALVGASAVAATRRRC